MDLNRKTPFKWIKKGLIYSGDAAFSHATCPCVMHYKDDIFVLACTRRDERQRSHIFLCYAEIADGKATLYGEPKLALKYGKIGHFDCDGVIGVCMVKDGGRSYLYYVGWQNLPEGMWSCNTGRAILNPDDLTLEREFLGPVLGTDKVNPLFASATAFYVKDGVWQTWYNAADRWEREGNGWKHYYGLHYAHSSNGVDWQCEKGMCIPFADEYEYAFGRPSVIVKDSTYYMWYAHRATKDIPTYRIGFALSRDGRTWERRDHLAGIDVASAGWDSEMICYPYVFEHKERLYMLYNGNNYGKTGFGLAVLED